MTSLFGTKYFGFIVSAYGITTVVLLLMVAWILLVHRSRKKQLARLEEAGIKRASRSNG
ncbi:MAG: heme exporter protein CcmD [Rhizobiaceae bacterium]